MGNNNFLRMLGGLLYWTHMTSFDDQLREYCDRKEAEQAEARETYVEPPLPTECCMCGKQMELVCDRPGQPYDGGSIQITFGYGSAKFDKHIGFTAYDGLICDDCAEKLVPRLRMRGYGMDGLIIAKPDSSNSLP